MPSSQERCIGCGSAKLRILENKALARGVTSDCKPWPRCGVFAICTDCAHMQKIQNETWQSDIAKIYGGYEVYFLSGGGEQVVFDGFKPLPRTQRLLEKLKQSIQLPTQGAMLDVGCANGSTLRTFNSLHPEWTLAGFDITSHSEATVRAIPKVTDFFTGSLDTIDRKFDLITMVYVVEHLPDPAAVLNQFRRLLKPNGIIWVHTSDYWANPFDMAVVDHSSHFMVDTLAELVDRCGFEVIDRNDNWNAKELGVIARWNPSKPAQGVDEGKKRQRLAGSPVRMQWLQDVVDSAISKAGKGRMGIFGTAIAGTYLANMLEDKAGFFVDEDRQRTSKTHMGLPVFALEEVPAREPIFLAFPTAQAMAIKRRLLGKHPEANLLEPPPLAA